MIVRDSLVRAEVGQPLTPPDFLNLASTLLGAGRLKAHFLRHAQKAPMLADNAKGDNRVSGTLARD